MAFESEDPRWNARAVGASGSIKVSLRAVPCLHHDQPAVLRCNSGRLLILAMGIGVLREVLDPHVANAFPGSDSPGAWRRKGVVGIGGE